MKKRFWLLLALAGSVICMLFSLTGCDLFGNGGSVDNEKPNPETPAHTTHVWSTTYTEDGDRHYQTCSGCNEKKYSDHDFTNGDCVCGKQKPVEIHTHSMTKHDAVAPTCTTAGNVLYYSCSNCHKNFADKEGKTELTETAVSATGHAMTKHDAVEPTCTTAGSVLYYSCSNCHKNFVEKEGNTELTETTIPVTGHTWDDNVCTVCHYDAGGSKGLTYTSYTSSTHEECYAVSGIGTCTDNEIEIPKIYNGKPVTAIRYDAFKDCSSLTSVMIGDGVTSIEYYAFENCNSLTNIAYTGDIKSWCEISGLDYLMRYGASDRKLFIDGQEIKGELVIPDAVTSIGRYTFYNCRSLTSVTIGNGVTSIGIGAFGYCRSLTSVTIGNGVTSIGTGAFEYCSSLTSVTIGDSVTSIGTGAFSSCSKLTSIVIPDSVTSIGGSAFWYCRSLTSVTIGNSVTSIWNETFDGCSSLTSVTIGDSVTSIGSNAFAGCGSLTNIFYTGDIKSWCEISGLDCLMRYGASDRKLFINGQEIKDELAITDGVTSIGDNAFYKCCSLISIVIPDSVMSMGICAFYGCRLLTNVEIPDSVTSIGIDAFAYCSSLTSVTIPDSVTSIGSYAFYGCRSLTSVEIPDSVTSIGGYAFSDCSSLNFNVYDNGKYLGNENNPYFAFIDITSTDITTCTIHNDTKVIASPAFAYCSSLTSVAIPDGVTSIASHAFQNCRSLTSVVIPDSVTKIGSWAFYDCNALTDITYRGTMAEWEAIGKGDSWDSNTGDYTVHCTDGDIKKGE